MSELLVVAYADREQATEVLETLCRLDIAWIARNYTIAVARDKKGRLRIPDQPQLSGATLTWRALWRRLLAHRSPAGGTAHGPRTQPASTAGIPETFIQSARDLVERSDSALILLIRTRLPVHIDEALSRLSGGVARTRLSATQEALLGSVLDVLGPVESKYESEQSADRGASAV
jgi:uncharacterized membrane protein